MKKNQKKNNKLIIGGLVALLIVGGGIGTIGALTKGFSNWNIKENFTKAEEDKLNDSIVEDGVSIKKVSTTNNSDGSTTKVYSYSVEPANATNQNVTISASFEDNTSCEDFISYTLDQTTKSVTLTTKKYDGYYGWDKVINVKLTSEYDPSLTAVTTLTYTKKNLEFSIVNSEQASVDVFPKTTQTATMSPFVNSVFSPRYTIDRNFTTGVAPIKTNLDMFMSYDRSLWESYYSSDYYFNSPYVESLFGVPYGFYNTNPFDNYAVSEDVLIEVYQGLINKFSTNVKRYSGVVTNTRILSITPEEVWNLSSDPSYHSYLKDIGYFCLGNGEDFDNKELYRDLQEYAFLPLVFTDNLVFFLNNKNLTFPSWSESDPYNFSNLVYFRFYFASSDWADDSVYQVGMSALSAESSTINF